MTTKLYFDFKKGGYINPSNYGVSITSSPVLVKRELGYALKKGLKNAFTLRNIDLFTTSLLTFELEVNFTNRSSYIGGFRNGAITNSFLGYGFTGFGSALSVQYNNPSGTVIWGAKPLETTLLGKYRLVITINGNNASVAVNRNIYHYTDFPSGTIGTYSLANSSNYISGNPGGASTNQFDIYLISISTEFLSDKEIVKRYVKFINSRPIQQTLAY